MAKCHNITRLRKLAMGLDLAPPSKETVCQALESKKDSNSRQAYTKWIADLWNKDDATLTAKNGASGAPEAPHPYYLEVTPLGPNGGHQTLDQFNARTGQTERVIEDLYGINPKTGELELQ